MSSSLLPVVNLSRDQSAKVPQNTKLCRRPTHLLELEMKLQNALKKEWVSMSAPHQVEMKNEIPFRRCI